MSDKNREKTHKVEAQPLKPLPMPEYRFQEDYTHSGTLDYQSKDDAHREPEKLDLAGVCLNFS